MTASTADAAQQGVAPGAARAGETRDEEVAVNPTAGGDFAGGGHGLDDYQAMAGNGQ